jgi:hypothetical protein
MMTDLKHDLREQALAAVNLITAFKEQLGDDVQAVVDAIEGETDFCSVVDAVLARIAELEDHIEALTIQGRKLNARNSRFKQQHEGLRLALKSALEIAQIQRMERPTATVAQARTPRTAVVTNADALPDAYRIPQPDKIDIRALTAALKDGSVPGAELSNGGATIHITRA